MEQGPNSMKQSHNSMKQSPITPWSTAILEQLMVNQTLMTLPALYNLQNHYHVHHNPQLVPILSKINPVHTLPTNFFRIQSNIILPSKPRSAEWSLFFNIHAHAWPLVLKDDYICHAVRCCDNRTTTSRQPITCKVMGGPFKSWSLAEYSGHLTFWRQNYFFNFSTLCI